MAMTAFDMKHPFRVSIMYHDFHDMEHYSFATNEQACVFALAIWNEPSFAKQHVTITIWKKEE
jgi:hypothetical protein